MKKVFYALSALALFACSDDDDDSLEERKLRAIKILHTACSSFANYKKQK